MRVIAGTARSMPLKTIEGTGTRPTTDRTKETLFNVLHQDLPGASFLDIFSGSGAIGIEALSRGARSAYFIEQNRAALTCIRDNLAFTKLADRAVVMECDALTGLKRLEHKAEAFDFIFMDPPYNQGLEMELLEFLQNSALVHEDTVIIIEASLETDFSQVQEYGFEVYKEKRYKTNQHVFLYPLAGGEA